VYAQNVIYSGFVNIASEGFNVPLIGLVNIAKGNHRLMQIGLFNWTQGNFGGFQTGLSNITGGNVSGLQLGLANITAGDVTGVELGLVNITKKITGLQIGLLNLVDDAEDGFPIGLLSIVRNGGYHAIEAGVSGNAAAHVALKLGVEYLYTSLFVFYNPVKDNVIGFGGGLGSIINISKPIFLNLEICSASPLPLNDQLNLNLDLLFGWDISSRLSIVAGPSVVMQWKNGNDEYDAPMFKLLTHDFNNESRVFIVAKAGIRLRF
jgi:hypothetical protein